MFSIRPSKKNRFKLTDLSITLNSSRTQFYVKYKLNHKIESIAFQRKESEEKILRMKSQQVAQETWEIKNSNLDSMTFLFFWWKIQFKITRNWNLDRKSEISYWKLSRPVCCYIKISQFWDAHICSKNDKDFHFNRGQNGQRTIWWIF